MTQNEMSPLLEKSNPSYHEVELDDATKLAKRKLQLACLLSLLFMIAEVIGGFLAGSLAIMTDAAHLLSDVAGFLISLFAIWAGGLPASSRMSYGFQRAEVVGAILSVLFIWVLTGCLVYAAVQRFIEALDPEAGQRVDGKIMFIVACVGLLVNLGLMAVLGHGHSHGAGGSHGHSHGGGNAHGHSRGGGESHGHSHGGGNAHGHSHGGGNAHGHSHGGGNSHDHNHEKGTSHNHGSHGGDEHGHCSHDHDDDENHSHEDNHHHNNDSKKHRRNINVHAAFIHALGDFVQSIGVCIAGGLIWYNPKWQIADPIATFLFSILVLMTTVGIITSSIHVLMEGAPEEIDVLHIEEGLRALPGVVTTHDLHIWSVTLGVPSLSVHIIADEHEHVLEAAQKFLISKGITHSTIQVEIAKKRYPRDCTTTKCGQNSPRKQDTILGTV